MGALVGYRVEIRRGEWRLVHDAKGVFMEALTVSHMEI
jgi:hypothetical protein